MNLIALKNFRNVKALRLRGKDMKSNVENSQHDDHVHKGARFAMGDAKTLKELLDADSATAYQVASLIASGCVGEADDKDVVAQVEAELKMEARKAENDKKLDALANQAELGKQILASLAALNARGAK